MNFPDTIEGMYQKVSIEDLKKRTKFKDLAESGDYVFADQNLADDDKIELFKPIAPEHYHHKIELQNVSGGHNKRFYVSDLISLINQGSVAVYKIK